MATRDLTTQFLRLRSVLRPRAGVDPAFAARGYVPADELRGNELRGNELPRGLGGQAHAAGAADAVAVRVAPAYVALIEDARSQLDALEQTDTQALRNAQARRLQATAVAMDAGDAALLRLEDEVGALQSAATARLRAGKEVVTKLLAPSGDGDDGAANAHVRRMAARELATRCAAAFRSLSKGQRTYLQELRRCEPQAAAQFAAAHRGDAEGGAPLMDDEQVAAQALAERDADDAESRSAEITRIARGIQELATMFAEMRSLVVEQGTMLDRIENNVFSAVVAVERGAKDLVVAEKLQARGGRCELCVALALMAAIAVLVMIIVLR
jgi:hypothetical protein